MRHKHADIIHAWAEGAEIELKDPLDGTWKDVVHPKFMEWCHYRIKPEEPNWWENIPKHGILVKSTNSGQVIAIYGKSSPYEMWTPLTNEEIERFKR